MSVGSEDNQKQYKPSDYMRDRRPHLFSDSTDSINPAVTKLQFEYHLDTITNRSEEKIFEHFCRALLEVEVCPNLTPQTGPTGGGDSKTDSENYLVSEEIAERWYVGDPKRASQEKWAFAFSAKKDWRPKAISDVKKIAATKRGYKAIFFVTNQFVKDKDRAEVEDQLQKEVQAEVRIFDRQWIVSKVFENQRLDIALRTLQIDNTTHQTLKVQGPEDYRRKQELEELERQIADVNRYKGVEFQLIEDCLQSALLARGLELPRTDIDGRFSRAIRLSKSHGTRRLQLRTMYFHAWTTFFWFDDAKEFKNQVKEIFKLGDFTDSCDIELLSNLYMSLKAAVINGLIGSKEAELEHCKEEFYKAVERAEKDTNRPANALWSKYLKIKHQIQEAHVASKPIDDYVSQLGSLIDEAKSYLEFPLVTAIEVIREIGPILDRSPSYDSLFEKMIAVTSQRTSEKEAGKLVLERGIHLLDSGKPYEAIRVLGKAQKLFATEESFSYLMKTLIYLGNAYFSVDLVWAARINFVTATERLTSKFWKENDLDKKVLYTLTRLVWIELMLGRIPWALTWIELLNVLERQLNYPPEKLESYNQERVSQDAVLGIHILHTKNEDLAKVNYLPLLCDRLGLVASESASWFALGDIERLVKEGLVPKSDTIEEIESFFKRLVTQPAKDDIRKFADYNLGPITTLSAVLFGCKITIELGNNPTSIVLAETILGVIENLFATSLGTDIYPYKSKFDIVIQIGKTKSPVPEFRTIVVSGEEKIEIIHLEDFYAQCGSMDLRLELRHWLLELALIVISKFTTIPEVENYLEKLIKEEQAFDRALLFSDLWITLDNLLGTTKRFSMNDWKPLAGASENKVMRVVSWISTYQAQKEPEEMIKPRPGTGEPPPELFDVEGMKHHEIEVSDIIDIPLWDKAKWEAVGVVIYDNFPPILMIGYNDLETGKKIFDGLRQKIGKSDAQEKLSVSIVRGLDEKIPNSYGVMIGPNVETLIKQGKRAYLISRMNRMYPEKPDSLNAFLEQYKKIGHYFLAPCDHKNLMGDNLQELVQGYGIIKKRLEVKGAWQIGENDQELSLLDEDVVPVIPAGIKNPPVLAALNKIKEIRSRKKNKN